MDRKKAIEARNREISKLFVKGIANRETFFRRPIPKKLNGERK